MTSQAQKMVTTGREFLSKFIPQIWHFLLNYSHFLHLLSLALFFYLFVWLIFVHVPPALVANWIFPDSYLLVQALLAAGNFLAATFVCQSRFMGAWFALVAGTFLFFRFSHFLLTPPLVVTLIVASICWWLWLFLWYNMSHETKLQ